MQLGDGVICIQQGSLLIHLTDDLCVCVFGKKTGREEGKEVKLIRVSVEVS